MSVAWVAVTRLLGQCSPASYFFISGLNNGPFIYRLILFTKGGIR